jgi:hypothetical protein
MYWLGFLFMIVLVIMRASGSVHMYWLGFVFMIVIMRASGTVHVLVIVVGAIY